MQLVGRSSPSGRPSGAWYRWVEQLEYAEGVYSCGCSNSPEPPRPRGAIEAEWLAMADADIERFDTDIPRSPRMREIVDHLRAGGHVLDERGRFLPEWAWYPSRR